MLLSSNPISNKGLSTLLMPVCNTPYLLGGEKLPTQLDGEPHGLKGAQKPPPHVGQTVYVVDVSGAAVRVLVVGVVDDRHRCILVHERV